MSEANRFAHITEIVECGWKKANLYLENGYELLGIYPFSRPIEKKGAFFVTRGTGYVMGRATDVAHYDPPEVES